MMRTWNKILYVVTMGLLAAATMSFAEGYGYNDPYQNHGGYAPTMGQYQSPYQRPVAPGGMGGGTIANGGGGMPSQNSYQQPQYGQQQNNMLFNPYLQPYLNSAPWGQYGYNQNQYTNPWTTNWNNGFGNTMQSPYYGQSINNQYGQYGMYNNGIPGLGYNVGGLGTSNFYDYGLGGQGNYFGGYGNQGYSPYGQGQFNYDPYGMGMGYGGNQNPYDYNGGYGGGYGGFGMASGY